MNIDVEAVIKNLVRVGSVSSVDVHSRTVRVAFADKQDADGNALISGALKVLQNQPLIVVEKSGAQGKWSFSAHYNSHNRYLGIGESYVNNKYEVLKDVIENELESQNDKEKITVYPWLPYVGQFVVCLYLPNGESDGFVIGGI